MVKIELAHITIPPPNSDATPALLALWEEVREWSHPDCPFLDRSYSPTSRMPAIDYTLWIRDRLLADDVDSIRQLMGYLENGSKVWQKQVEDFCRWRIAAFEEQPILEAELRASMMLCYRKGFQNLPFQWKRIWSAVLAAHAAPALESDLAVKMRLCSPTLRLVLANCWLRNERQVFRVDWSLGYGDREYGCSGAWNEHYGEWLAVFESPTVETPFPKNLLTKEALVAEAAALGIELDAKVKKDVMLAEVAKHPQLMASLWEKHGTGFLKWKESAKGALEEWIQRYLGWNENVAEIAADAAIHFMAFQYENLPGSAFTYFKQRAADTGKDLLKLIFEAQNSAGYCRSRHLQGMTANGHCMSPAVEIRFPPGVEVNFAECWAASGGPPLINGRFIAPKKHSVWLSLGDPSLFEGGLGLGHAPFWVGFEGYENEVPYFECERLGMIKDGEWTPTYFQPECEIPAGEPGPPTDPETRAALKALLEELGPIKTTSEILGLS